MRRSHLLSALVLFGIPAFVYALIATKGTFNFFYPDYGWVFYNQYAIAIANGRLWFPAEAIGPEGLYIGGRVYAYYGMLPAILRLPFTLFADLRDTPVSVLMNWALTTAGSAALQVAALDAYRWRATKGASPSPRWMLLLASACIWFFSGAILVIQNASFYHEPFAAALLASGLFTFISVRVLLFGDGLPSARQLIAMAVLAGACLFARQTTTISLYAACLVWLAVSGWRTVHDRGFNASTVLAWSMTRAAAPLSILFLAGVTYLALNAVRFADLGSSFPIDHYGYLLMDPENERMITIRDQGQFHWARVAPNAIFALIGGVELREQLITMLGGGVTGVLGAIIRLAYAWTPSFLLSLMALIWLVREGRRSRIAALALMILSCLALGAVLQLSYPTVFYRYHADLWPPLGFLVVLSVAFGDLVFTRASSAKVLAVAGAASFALSAIYVSSLTLKPLPDENDAMYKPLPEALSRLATAPGARDPNLPGGTPPAVGP
jgi:hypothetical protein